MGRRTATGNEERKEEENDKDCMGSRPRGRCMRSLTASASLCDLLLNLWALHLNLTM